MFAYVAANPPPPRSSPRCSVLVSLTLLNVPGAFMLAVLAGVCDFVPILGFFVALTLAVLVALTIFARHRRCRLPACRTGSVP